MEIANWLEWTDVLHGSLPPGRLYLGCEGCENMLPGIDEMGECMHFLSSLERDLTLVTPLMTDAGIRKLTGLLETLGREARRIEVVCNDWGAFETILQYGFVTPVIGRLLGRQSTDPRFSAMLDGPIQKSFEKEVIHLDGTRARLTYRPPGAALVRHLKRPALMNTALLEFLSGLGVQRFEVSNLLQGVEISVPADWHVSLHVSTVPIALRRCHARGSAACGSRCGESFTRLALADFPVPLYMSRTEVFYRNEHPSSYNEETGIDRVVYQSARC